MVEGIFEIYGSFLAPDLIRVEVSSAITRKVRNNAISRDIAYKKLTEWKEFLDKGAIELIPSEDLLKNAETFSIDLRHPLKGCLYLAAAKRHNTILVTADQPVIDSLAGRFPNVRHLGGFGD